MSSEHWRLVDVLFGVGRCCVIVDIYGGPLVWPHSDVQGVKVKKTAALHMCSRPLHYMPGSVFTVPITCTRRLRASNSLYLPSIVHYKSRPFSSISPLLQEHAHKQPNHEETTPNNSQIRSLSSEKTIGATAKNSNDGTDTTEQGAMSRHLEEATEEALLTGGRAGQKAIAEAGFSEDLKQKLLDKIENAKFKSEHASAFAEAGLQGNVRKGSRDVAAGQAWAGEEQTEDTVLRMLDDSKKPLSPAMRGKAKVPLPVVDLRLKAQTKQKPGARLANARDKTSVYASIKDTQMSEEERAAMRQELKDRFTPGARAMPNSIRGLAALANDRIEDAIARGQFKV